MTQRSSRVVPFVGTDGIIHRVSNDTNDDWVDKWTGRLVVQVFAQCEDFVAGRIEEGRAISCLGCIAAGEE